MIGIIGGSGIYDLPGLDILEERAMETPFGAPSAPCLRGTYGGSKKVVFLPRHGASHEHLPHEVNYRANIWALKKMGVTRLVGVSAVGSLRLEFKPGDLCIPDQYFDFVKGPREKSFFGDGLVAHVSTAEPTCPKLAKSLRDVGETIGIPVHTGVTYGCVDGPRLGTRAESFFLQKSAGCDLVGMTNVPEAFLAREAQMCYCTIAVVTDYDCWLDDRAQHVSVDQVIARFGASLEKAKRLLGDFLEHDLTAPDNNSPGCDCRQSLQSAILTPEDALSQEKQSLLALLKA